MPVVGRGCFARVRGNRVLKVVCCVSVCVLLL